MVDTGVEHEIDDLLKGPQYAMPAAEKDRRLLALLRSVCADQADRCEPYKRFLTRLGRLPFAWASLEEIPPLPASVFKRHTLCSVPSAQVVRELTSSATTHQHPSRIFLDKATAFRQSRALVSVLREHLGTRRRPLLVLDAAESAQAGDSLSARGAAIRGMASFASETVYALRKSADDLLPDFDAVAELLDRCQDQPVLLFGFTFIVWTRFVEEALRRGVSYHAPRAMLLHSGGWKKLESQAVSKEVFSAGVAGVLGCPTEAVLDFYGMVEQVGTVFVDCPAGNKHAPAFAEVLIRRPGSLRPVSVGEAGIIEVLSVLPSSYPGNAVITEDEGVLLGIDDCPCGRAGRYFRFLRRIEQAEIRGCGDTFAEKREAAG